MIELDDKGQPLKKIMILQAQSAMQMEQNIIEAMKAGYEVYGELGISDGVFFQMMIRAKKIVRVGS